MTWNTTAVITPGSIVYRANITDATQTWSEDTLAATLPFNAATQIDHDSVLPGVRRSALASEIQSSSFLDSSNEEPELGKGSIRHRLLGNQLVLTSGSVCTLNAKLGEGSFGSVWGCGKVAVKFISQNMSKFRDEFRMQQRVVSTNVVKVIEEFLLDTDSLGDIPKGSLVIVMERLGQNLWEAMKHGDFKGKPERIKRVFREVLQGVQDIHKAGLISRDIKPLNIVCTGSNPDTMHVKLCDFGIATQRDVEHTDIEGTPAYMPPECFTAPYTHGEAVDAWALGVLLYEMYFGKQPFEGNFFQLMTSIPTKPVVFFHDKDVPEAPFQLKDLIRKCLDKNPTSRLLVAPEDPQRKISNHPWLMDALSAAKAETDKLNAWLEKNGFDDVSHRHQANGKAWCPLHKAVLSKDVEMVEILLKHSSDTMCMDEQEKVPVQLLKEIQKTAKSNSDETSAYNEILGHFATSS